MFNKKKFWLIFYLNFFHNKIKKKKNIQSNLRKKNRNLILHIPRKYKKAICELFYKGILKSEWVFGCFIKKNSTEYSTSIFSTIKLKMKKYSIKTLKKNRKLPLHTPRKYKKAINKFFYTGILKTE